VLQAAGVSQAEEQVYRLLLAWPAAPMSELERETGNGRRQLAKVLRGLEDKGLVSHAPGEPLRFVAAPPDVAVAALVQRRQRELEHVRTAVASLQDTFRNAVERSPRRPLVEVVSGSEAVAQRVAQLQSGAAQEIMSLSKPPLFAGVREDGCCEQYLATGLSYRVVYEHAAFDAPAVLDHVLRHIDAGQQARVLEKLPAKLLIADRCLGLVSIADDERDKQAVLVHASPLLDALIGFFEALWDRAVPVHLPRSGEVRSGEGLDYDDERILALLAAGFKDDGVARQLGVSGRTVQRRIAGMMNALNATSRFQAGLQAARRGWA
jgi:DNA-binding CsgD family transcriptional regulator